jgi:hypothetical protein
MREARAAARTLGIEIVPLEIRRAEDIVPVFAMLNGSGEALYAVGSALVDTNRARIIKLEIKIMLPGAQRPQSSSASRFTAGAFGFLTFIQCGDRPERWESQAVSILVQQLSR